MAEKPYRDPYAGRRLPDSPPNALGAALRGFVGQEEPGSVLDPTTAKQKQVNNKAQLASILTDLVPPKGLAGAAGVLVPLLRGLNKDATATKFLEQQASIAADALRQGASHSEIQKLTGLYKAPGSYPGLEHAKKAEWLHNVELDPTKPVWRKGYSDADGFMQRDQPAAPLEEVLQLSTNSSSPGAFENLYRQYPQLFDTKARATSAPVPGKQGQFSASKDQLEVYGSAVSPFKTFAHELNHAIMNKTGQYQLTGFGMRPIDQTRGIQQGLDMEQHLQGVLPHEILRDMRRTLNIANNPGKSLAFRNGWNKSAGERTADSAGFMDEANILGQDLPPMLSMQGTISDAIPRALGDSLWYLGQGHKQKPVGMVAETFVNRLRTRNLLPTQP